VDEADRGADAVGQVGPVGQDGNTAAAEDGAAGPDQRDGTTAAAESASQMPDATAPPSSTTRRNIVSGWSSRWRVARLPRLAALLRGTRARLVALGGAIALGAMALGFLHASGTRSPPPSASAATLAGTLSGSATLQPASATSPDGGSEIAAEEAQRPEVWRVAQLADDTEVSLIDGVIARRPLLVALAASGLPRPEAKRVADALGDVRDVDHFGPKDSFVVASQKASGHVVAFEVASSPVEVWQGREEADSTGTPKLRMRKLDLNSEQVRVRKAVLVAGDLRASVAEAGFSGIDEVLKLLDDALDGHAELSDIRPGARLRLVATEERVDGGFVRWASIEAVEYLPATPNAPAIRVYRFGSEENSKHHGWFDAKGKQPYHGGWRSPVPLARIASRFNPRRMHPVLHVVMPHNGVDFAAPIGAPVYATAAGTVSSVGMEGPCGNKVEIDHDGGITSVYCHLSRFAAGLHAGQHVEARQLIAYVGQTGRVTGPHLHFGIKRNGTFIDPMKLRLDGVRIVPRSRRAEFDRHREDLDAELDTIALPQAPAGGPLSSASSEGVAPAETETFYEEQ
jgi:murein DD-endopeptidase MepM/ murein hydrolase activator NlpD